MTRRRGRLRVLVPCVALALLATGCPGGPGPDRPATTGAWSPQPCPSDVEVSVVPEHTCGWVEAPLGEGTQQVFVVVVEPPTASGDAPILETGTDLGMTPNYAGLAPIAQRTGRRTAIVDLPGTGHSLPSLDCPGAEALGDVPGDDPVLLEAVGACRDRLLGEGVDPTLMTPRESAGALMAVMDALDDGPWVLMGHGTTSAVAAEVARLRPERVQAVVMDSPLQAHRGWPARRAALVSGVAEACASAPRCARRHGDVRRLWRLAARRARTEPTNLGARRLLDTTLLDRAVRWLVAPTASGPAQLPDLLDEAATGRPGPWLDRMALALEEAPPLCVGLLPKCYDRQQVVLGAVLSTVCPEAATATDFAAACERWGVGEDPGGPTSIGDVPLLVLQGELDPFASPGEVAEVAARWTPDAYVVVVPGSGHNVLGDECVRSVRTAWLADPGRAPAQVPCLDERWDFP